MFFNKKAVQFTIVDKPQAAIDGTHEESHILHPDKVKLIAEQSIEVVKHVAIAVVAVYAAFKAVDTVSQVVIKKTKSADNE